MSDLRVKLHAIEMTAFIGHTRIAARVSGSHEFEAGWELGDLVAM